jgi:hypothetical protein
MLDGSDFVFPGEADVLLHMPSMTHGSSDREVFAGTLLA